MSTHYTAGSMPLAFTQEDFLVERWGQWGRGGALFLLILDFDDKMLKF